MEGRCACLFDRLAWEWEYEPFSLMLPNGIAYTPDFLITNLGMLIECRGYENSRSIRQIASFVSLIEREFGFELPAYGRFCEYMVIGPSRVSLYTSWERKYCDVPFEQREPYMQKGGILYKCDCGWGPLNPAQWCPNCEKVAIAAIMISVQEGRILLNGTDTEDIP